MNAANHGHARLGRSKATAPSGAKNDHDHRARRVETAEHDGAGCGRDEDQQELGRPKEREVVVAGEDEEADDRAGHVRPWRERGPFLVEKPVEAAPEEPDREDEDRDPDEEPLAEAQVRRIGGGPTRSRGGGRAPARSYGVPEVAQRLSPGVAGYTASGTVPRTMCSVNIVVANVKGGVGKTTTAVYLAAAAAERGDGPVLLIDADRQASSAEWLEERPVEGVEVVEAPSERTLAKAVSRRDGLSVVDGPPGDTRLLGAAAGAADVVIIPTRAAGVEISPVLSTLELIPSKTPRGVVITAARLGTNDLDETIAFWRREGIRIWGVVPERVGIAAGPEARLLREGLQHYDGVLRRALRGRR